MEIQVGHKAYDLKREHDESNTVLAKRIWFIIDQEPQNDSEMERVREKEKVWYNIKFLGCHYHPRTELIMIDK